MPVNRDVKKPFFSKYKKQVRKKRFFIGFFGFLLFFKIIIVPNDKFRQALSNSMLIQKFEPLVSELRLIKLGRNS